MCKDGLCKFHIVLFTYEVRVVYIMLIGTKISANKTSLIKKLISLNFKTCNLGLNGIYYSLIENYCIIRNSLQWQ